MAKGNVMLQLEVSQIFAAAVTFVPQINALVFDTFDGNLTRIREIAIQKVGHHSGTPNVKAFQTSSEIALQQVFWVSARGPRPLVVFYGHLTLPRRPSRTLKWSSCRCGTAITSPSPGERFFLRAIDAHTYLDESPALPTPSVS